MYMKLRVDVYSNIKMMLSLLVDPVLRFSSAPSLVKSTACWQERNRSSSAVEREGARRGEERRGTEGEVERFPDGR